MPSPSTRSLLAVATVGSGPRLVLTHGLGDRAATWDPIVKPLSKRHALTTWDLRGHGASPRPAQPAQYSQGLALGDLELVVERAGAPVHLVGHSLGGYLSLVLALRRPELVRSLTLIASGPGFRDAGARRRWNAYVDEAAARMDLPAGAARLAHQRDGSVMRQLADLRPPLLQIVGERDRQFHAGVDHIARTVAGSRVVRAAGAGHHPQRSHPTLVVQQIEQLVAGAEG
jgi:pimeloyl-ACP methyl ester carboxylesterase